MVMICPFCPTTKNVGGRASESKSDLGICDEFSKPATTVMRSEDRTERYCEGHWIEGGGGDSLGELIAKRRGRNNREGSASRIESLSLLASLHPC